MGLTAQPVPLTPFTGGMNNRREIGTLADDELAYVLNMEMDQDGSLVSRPAFLTESDNPEVAGEVRPVLELLGTYTTTAGVTSLVIASETATWLYQTVTKVWTQIWSNRANGYVQYDNKVVLCSTTIAGGYWEAGTWTATASMPLAQQIEFYQERFWAFGARGTADQTTVWFSNLTGIDPPTSIWDWDAQDYFTVSAGDGQWVTGLMADQAGLIIFRSDSTFIFTYPTAPISGTLRQVSATTGAENQFAFARHENYAFTFSGGVLYQFLNLQFYPLSDRKISFKRATFAPGDLAANIRVSVFGERAIVWYYGNTYVYSVLNRNWSVWESPTIAPARIVQIDNDGDTAVAYAVSGKTADTFCRLYTITDEPVLAGTGEAMDCVIRTKSYTFGAPEYKRLHYWMTDLRISSDIAAYVYPQSEAGGQVTFDEMDLHTFDDFEDGTWDNPLLIPSEMVDEIQFGAQTPVMRAVKWRAPLRFTRAYFELQGTTDGTVANAPFRVYGMIVYIVSKSVPARKVS